jgi:hypothetical protein
MQLELIQLCFYRSINDGYNGQILSTDEHLFDSSKFDNSYDFNCRLGLFFCLIFSKINPFLLQHRRHLNKIFRR